MKNMNKIFATAVAAATLVAMAAPASAKLSEKSGWHLVVGGTDRFLYNYFIDTEVNKQ